MAFFMSSKPIGIFDSGVGGLTVMAAIREALPGESLIYLGDTARVPYGTKSAETILRYTEESLTFLAKKNVKAIVIACNSASAHALPYLQHKFNFPVLGVIESGVRAALRATRNKNIGVIGTLATIASDIYAKELKRLDETIVVKSEPCPLFVPLVEEGWFEHAVTCEVAEHYLKPFANDGIDTLILGCTHYPLLKNIIARVLAPPPVHGQNARSAGWTGGGVGEKIKLIDSAKAVAEMLKEVLGKEKLLNQEAGPTSLKLYVTDFPARFEILARQFLKERLPAVKRVVL